jgi:hypothetical protein
VSESSLGLRFTVSRLRHSCRCTPVMSFQHIMIATWNVFACS